MKRDDAASLVNRIVSTWPTGVKGYIWTEVLTDLDAGPAELAYRRLRADYDRAPSVAAFLASYRAVAADRERVEQPPASEPTEELISLGEYLRRLDARATAGDDQAATERATWRRFLNRNPGTVPHSRGDR